MCCFVISSKLTIMSKCLAAAWRPTWISALGVDLLLLSLLLMLHHLDAADNVPVPFLIDYVVIDNCSGNFP